MKISLLLGSGVSLLSGLPGVAELTDELLNGTYYRDAKRHGRFYAQRPDLPQVLSLEDVQQLLRLLRDLDTHYLGSIAPFKSGGTYGRTGAVLRATTSYEDLAYLCQRIIGSGDGLLDDAQAGAFSELVEKRAGDLLGGGPVEARLIELYVLAREAFRFTRWLVATSLQTEHIAGLDSLVDLARSKALEVVDIVTLNHDTLVEQSFIANDIDFVDGFGNPDGDVRWYDDSTYDVDAARVRIFKLHGSIDWYLFLVDSKTRIAVVTGDPLHCRDGLGRQLQQYDKTPQILSGVDKAMSYNRGIYADMVYRLHRALREHDTMLVSGYGWGDAGINFRLDDWLDRDKRNRIVLLHENPDELAQRSLPFRTSFSKRSESKQITVLPEWLCDASCREIEEAIARP